MKKLLFLVFLAFLTIPLFVSAESISNYKVPNNVPLNKNLTIYGQLLSDNNSNVLCNFFIFDVNNTDYNQLIERLDDQYTNSNGEFTSRPYQILEPKFQRGIDYNAITTCGTASIGKIFHVSQKEDILLGLTSQSIINDFRFWTEPENSFAFVFYGLSLLAIAILAALLINSTNIKQLLFG